MVVNASDIVSLEKWRLIMTVLPGLLSLYLNLSLQSKPFRHTHCPIV